MLSVVTAANVVLMKRPLATALAHIFLCCFRALKQKAAQEGFEHSDY